jgi:DNA-binding MarR family transcriptional regulator
MSESSESNPPDSVLLVEAFARFMPAYKRWVELKFEKGTLSYARLRLIGTLYLRGPMIMSRLGDKLGVSSRNVTKLVDALEQERLVRRVPHPTDRRATVIESTPEGIKVGEYMLREHSKVLAGLFEELSEHDQADLLRTVTRLHAVVERRLVCLNKS